MIVKCQLPISGEDLALIYSEDRSILMRVPSSYVRKRFRPGELKAYFEAKIDGGDLHLGDRHQGEEPSW